jgi:hypothetical protein
MSMTERVNLAHSAVARFVGRSPSDEDVKNVKELLENVARNPGSGVQIPFTSQQLKGIYVTWTPD